MTNATPSDTGVLLCGHGSRDPQAAVEFIRVVGGLRRHLPEQDVDYGYLELAEPSIPTALASMYARGCRKISVLPGMLFAAAHVKEDIPEILEDFRKSHPDVEITFARELGVSENLIHAAAEKLELALSDAEKSAMVPAGQTALLVVGRGSNDVAALQDLENITARLQSASSLPHARTCYANVATPIMEDVLAEVLQQDYRRIIFLPWFLFTGVLMQRLYGAFRAAAKTHPTVDFIEIDYFRDHPMVVKTFAERFHELS